MADTLHPALRSLIDQISPELDLAQVQVRRLDHGFELRHRDDRQAAADALRSVPVEGLRELAQFSEEGVFRPLKAAPNLRRGWVCCVPDARQLGRALEHLLPGAVADCHAARQANPPITNYREFTARQTGMYRNTAQLEDAGAVRVTVAVCHAGSCLKRRLWTVPTLDADPADVKSVVPCLEPCAVLLEFARKAWRWGQSPPVSCQLSEPEWETLQASLRCALGETDRPTGHREADFDDPLNPRRVRYVQRGQT